MTIKDDSALVESTPTMPRQIQDNITWSLKTTVHWCSHYRQYNAKITTLSHDNWTGVVIIGILPCQISEIVTWQLKTASTCVSVVANRGGFAMLDSPHHDMTIENDNAFCVVPYRQCYIKFAIIGTLDNWMDCFGARRLLILKLRNNWMNFYL